MPGRTFKVVTWNLMAPEYAARMASGRDFYAKQREWIPWELRLPRILDRLVRLDADVVCLQEVSNAHLEGTLRTTLERLGYEIASARKTHVFQPDGLLLLHRTGRGKVEADDVCGFLDDTGYVAQIRRVRLDRTSPAITIANAHLKWAADDELQATQLRTLLARLDAFPPGPRLVCGDLNVHVEAHPVWADLASRGFVSAYPGAEETWAADGRARKLDLLAFTNDLSLVSSMPLPILDPVIGLPGPHEPSDHLPLCATLAMP